MDVPAGPGTVCGASKPKRSRACDSDLLRCRGGVGAIGWPGAYGGWWQADPNDRSILIFLAHNMVELPQMARGVGLGVWSAIATFHEIASA